MSLFDGKATISPDWRAGRRGGNNNRNNNNQNKNNNQNRNNNNNYNRNGSNNRFDNNSGRGNAPVRRFDNEERRSFSNDQQQMRDNRPENDFEKEKEVLRAFVEDYTKNADNVKYLQTLLVDDFGDIMAIMKNYYDQKYLDKISGEMNAVFDLMTTQSFASTLMTVLKQNMIDDWDNKVWKDTAVVLSLLLKTSYKKMKDETIQVYTFDMLASGGMWKPEISKLINELGISKEMALDLVIACPFTPDDWRDLAIRHYYQGLLNTVIDHAEENSDVLDAACQAKLFEFCFGTRKTALKVLGRYLTGEPMTGLEGTNSLIYNEFISMIYSKLDSYDIPDIKFVLKFIINVKKENPDKVMMFNTETAAKYDSIRKVIMNCIQDDESAKEYLS